MATAENLGLAIITACARSNDGNRSGDQPITMTDLAIVMATALSLSPLPSLRWTYAISCDSGDSGDSGDDSDGGDSGDSGDGLDSCDDGDSACVCVRVRACVRASDVGSFESPNARLSLIMQCVIKTSDNAKRYQNVYRLRLVCVCVCARACARVCVRTCVRFATGS